jgi:hypothetical protein
VRVAGFHDGRRRRGLAVDGGARNDGGGGRGRAGAETVHFHEGEHGDCADGRDASEGPPGDYHVSYVHTERERPTSDCGACRSPKSGNTGRDAVKGPQDAERASRVGEEDGGAGESEDDGKGFDKHEGEHGDFLDKSCGEEGRERGKDVDDGEDEGDNFEAVQDAEFAGDRGKDEKLDDHPEYAVEGEQDAYAAGIWSRC